MNCSLPVLYTNQQFLQVSNFLLCVVQLVWVVYKTLELQYLDSFFLPANYIVSTRILNDVVSSLKILASRFMLIIFTMNVYIKSYTLATWVLTSGTSLYGPSKVSSLTISGNISLKPLASSFVYAFVVLWPAAAFNGSVTNVWIRYHQANQILKSFIAFCTYVENSF